MSVVKEGIQEWKSTLQKEIEDINAQVERKQQEIDLANVKQEILEASYESITPNYRDYFKELFSSDLPEALENAYKELNALKAERQRKKTCLEAVIRCIDSMYIED